MHIGAAAAAASLRRDLVEVGQVESWEFDEAYAVSRLTPGTNLLALYTLLGRRLGGLRGTVLALGAGTVVPAFIACALAVLYTRYAAHPLAAKAMQGARSGALAVFLLAILRLIQPPLRQHGLRGLTIALVTLAIMMTLPFPPFLLLVLGGGLSALALRPAE